MNTDNELYNLFIRAFENQRKFVASKITNLKNREYYNKAADNILDDTHNSTVDFWRFGDSFIIDRYRMKQALKDGFFSSPQKYTVMAYDHALELLDSLTTRFVEGGSRGFEQLPKINHE